jgi:hypothetical protein
MAGSVTKDGPMRMEKNSTAMTFLHTIYALLPGRRKRSSRTVKRLASTAEPDHTPGEMRDRDGESTASAQRGTLEDSYSAPELTHRINLLPKPPPTVSIFSDHPVLTTRCKTVEIGPGVSFMNGCVIEVEHGCRIIFKGMNIINADVEFRFMHPKGPLDWEGNPYR